MLTRVHGVVALALVLGGCRDLPTLVAVNDGHAIDSNTPPEGIVPPDPNGGVVPVPQATAYMSTANGQLVRNGTVLALHGVGWFGFETSSAMLQGSWGSDAITGDFATVVRRMRALGINAVRLPFSFANLYANARPTNLTHGCNAASDSDLAASLTPPGGQPPASVPPLPNPPTRTPGQCNDYLPNDSVWNEFVWMVQFFARNGFYVLIDDHGRAENLAVTDPNAWVRDWKALVTQLVTDPNTAAQLMIGPVADVETLGLHWQAKGNQPAAGDLFLKAMDALHPIAPHALFYIGGTVQDGVYADGFATSGFGPSNAADDATPFFRQLVQRAYAPQVVMAPNAYGPQVITIQGATTGTAFVAALTRSFGYLNHTGFCDAGVCTRFAVSVWGFGSDLGPGDAPTMNDIASYMTASGTGSDGLHDAMPSWFWWCWNGNASPSMGILDSSWSALQWNKVTYLQGVGLPN